MRTVKEGLIVGVQTLQIYVWNYGKCKGFVAK
jgi:hypothetical protein